MPSFAISKYETTYAQFSTWADKNGLDTNVDKRAADEPATKVTWFEARAFCKAHGLELPTEYQWEYAARAGLRRQYGVVNSTEELQAFAVFGLGVDANPAKVGSKQASAGLHDMIGNVLEWTLSAYKDYELPDNLLTPVIPETPSQTPENIDRSAVRVLRGGSFRNSLTWSLRSADRNWFQPDVQAQATSVFDVFLCPPQLLNPRYLNYFNYLYTV